MTLAIYDCKKPVIGAINGAAVGIGTQQGRRLVAKGVVATCAGLGGIAAGNLHPAALGTGTITSEFTGPIEGSALISHPGIELAAQLELGLGVAAAQLVAAHGPEALVVVAALNLVKWAEEPETAFLSLL